MIEISVDTKNLPPQAGFMRAPSSPSIRTEFIYNPMETFAEDGDTLPEVRTLVSEQNGQYIKDFRLVDDCGSPLHSIEVHERREVDLLTTQIKIKNKPVELLQDLTSLGYKIRERRIVDEARITVSGEVEREVAKFALDPTRVNFLHEMGYVPCAWKLVPAEGFIPGGQGGRRKGVVYFINDISNEPLILTNHTDEAIKNLESIEDLRKKTEATALPKSDQILFLVLVQSERKSEKVVYIPGEFNALINASHIKDPVPFSRTPYKAGNFSSLTAGR